MLRHLSLATLFWLFAGGVACTSMLSIDGDYQPTELAAGGSFGAPGGAAAAGFGATSDTENGGSSGSLPPAGGAGGTAVVHAGGSQAAGGSVPAREAGTPLADGGMCTPSDCTATEKCCTTLAAFCVPQGPIVGCGAPGCDACPAPPDNGIDICTKGACAIRCNDGFTEQAGKCVPNGTGGTGSGGAQATGGAAGAGGAACVPTKCPTCNIAGPLQCCRNDGTCGCTWWDPAHLCY